MNRRHDDTRRGRAIEEARRWATVVLIAVVVWLSYQVSTLGGAVDRIEKSSSRTEVAADELVAFVHEIQAQQPCGTTTTSTTTTTAPCQPSSGGQGQAQVVQMIVNLLCASSDPARQQACAALTQPGGTSSSS